MKLVDTVYVDAVYTGEIKLNKQTLDHIKNLKTDFSIKKIALFASVQFLNLDLVRSQLKELNLDVLTTKAKRTDKETQILGCDSYHDSFADPIIEESDALLYVGDGLFHPQALLYSQIHSKKIKEIILYDPIGNHLRIIDRKNISENIEKLRKNIKAFISAKNIGIIVTLKPGQQYLTGALKLREKLNSEGKNAYVFVDNTIDMGHFENYPFIEVWINTACPRIGFDDIIHAPKPLININYALNPIHYLETLNTEKHQ